MLFEDNDTFPPQRRQSRRGFSSLQTSSSRLFSFPSTEQVETAGWSQSRLRVQAWIDSKRVDTVMGAIILGNLILIVIETNANAVCETSKDPLCDVPLEVKIINPFLLAIYTVELLTRLYAYRGWFFYCLWNILDICVVASGLVDFALNTPNLTAIRVFRLLRLIRTVRLLSHFPELYDMMRGFGGAMKAMFWGFTIIVLMLGLWSLLAVEFVHPVNQDVQHGDPWCADAFSSVEKATLFFFQTLVAGDSWGQCTIPIIEKSVATVLIFALALVSVQLGFTNLILAVIVEAAHQAKEKDYESRLREKRRYEKECVDLWRSVIEGLDVDKSGSISIEELKKGYLEQPEVSKILGLLDVDWQDLETLYRLMDSDNSGEVSYIEFFHCLRRAHTQDMRMYLMNVKLQITYMTGLVNKQLSMMREGFARIQKFPREPIDPNTVADEFEQAKNIHPVRPSPWRSRAKLPADTGPLSLGVEVPQKVVLAGRVDNNVPYPAPAPFDDVAFPDEEDEEEEPKSTLRAASVGLSSETTELEPSLTSSYMASLGKLRVELEQRLDEIAQTAAAAAVTLAQSTKSLEAIASEGAPALDSVGNSVSSPRAFYSRGRQQREHRALVQAVMGQMIPSGGSHVPPSTGPPRAASLSSSFQSTAPLSSSFHSAGTGSRL